MSSSPTAAVAYDSKLGKKGMKDTRAQWSKARTSFLASILKEFPRYRGQNGWEKEAWNAMAQRMNEKFVSSKFIVS
ncbi:hypothetical protein BAE44_0019464 [Dichanthelium oligosanthes]|uniref:Myb/SANT-like domain-containing protein n=1 Tax=Dichanthelium oligosanthes TaxID=888268 RepID=A0A1E5V386_9POAL|nr:hypothetical protein BAE44_0019464 [Dichanthelium oligosanthes]